MKKFVLTSLVIILFLSMLFVSAKPGDVAGEYYGTDIKAYLNYYEIDSINIGGQTLISAEAMRYYGFEVIWDEVERTLHIKAITPSNNVKKPSVSAGNHKLGVPIGYYYETDIITYLDGMPITAYNIGGMTYILAESMKNFGYTVNWYEEKRMLEILSFTKYDYEYDIPLFDSKSQNEEGIGAFSVTYSKDEIILTGDAEYFSLRMWLTDGKYRFNLGFYQSGGLYYSLKLIDTLKKLCYDGYDVESTYDKSEKYDVVNRHVNISVNGIRASEVSIESGAGNGHRDFYITVYDLPLLRKDEIHEIVFSVE